MSTPASAPHPNTPIEAVHHHYFVEFEGDAYCAGCNQWLNSLMLTERHGEDA